MNNKKIKLEESSDEFKIPMMYKKFSKKNSYKSKD
jgi:hypothetical protein